MRWQPSLALLESKFARRILVLFVVCALVPTVMLAGIAYVQVSGQLRASSRQRLRDTAKSSAIDVFTRFDRLTAELSIIDTALHGDAETSLSPEIEDRFARHFSTLALDRRDGSVVAIRGDGSPAPVTPREVSDLESRNAVLRISPAGDVTLIRRSHVGGSTNYLIATAQTPSLWFESDLVPPSVQVGVITDAGVVLFSTVGWRAPTSELMAAVTRETQGSLEWTDRGVDYQGAYWTLPTAHDYGVAGITILVGEERAAALAPIASARVTFLLVLLLSLWTVCLLSLVQIRRSLEPLTLLTTRAHRLGEGDFDASVVVNSNDEFQTLAEAFNSTTVRLKRQFQSLSARAALDRAVLSSLDVDTILQSALARLAEVVRFDVGQLVAFGATPEDDTRAFTFVASASATITSEPPPPLRTDDVRRLLANAHIEFRNDGDRSPYVLPPAGVSWRRGIAFPVVIDDGLAAMLTVLVHDPQQLTTEDVAELRGLLDQVSIALSNARLLEALDRLNIGTLNALARTVDAKSPWTAGHSQRVTALAVALGSELDQPASVLDVLERGSLLHDIGKIAVPSSILNKPGPLTPEEFEVVKTHPATGARILEPIREYQQLIPIVLQHHERLDGRGYPNGLAGDRISFEARIVAVADVFDAVTSKRPYRDVVELDRAARIIREGSGSHFDPRVVAAFERLAASHHPAVCPAPAGDALPVATV